MGPRRSSVGHFHPPVCDGLCPVEEVGSCDCPYRSSQRQRNQDPWWPPIYTTPARRDWENQMVSLINPNQSYYAS